MPKAGYWHGMRPAEERFSIVNTAGSALCLHFCNYFVQNDVDSSGTQFLIVVCITGSDLSSGVKNETLSTIDDYADLIEVNYPEI